MQKRCLCQHWCQFQQMHLSEKSTVSGMMLHAGCFPFLGDIAWNRSHLVVILLWGIDIWNISFLDSISGSEWEACVPTLLALALVSLYIGRPGAPTLRIDGASMTRPVKRHKCSFYSVFEEWRRIMFWNHSTCFHCYFHYLNCHFSFINVPTHTGNCYRKIIGPTCWIE